MNRIAVLSDIHANLTALRAVIKDIKSNYDIEEIILLGDVINYGMRPNEVIHELILLEEEYSIICNLQGNHENALFSGGLERFSSERGRKMLSYTKEQLSILSIEYIKNKMEEKGRKDLNIDGRRILCIHGNLEDPFWGKLTFDRIQKESYRDYDYVISGHTHLPHHLECFFEVEDQDMRNKKRIVFLNPGSVGQPRNHNTSAQYLYLDFDKGIIHNNAVPYDVLEEQGLYKEEEFEFYKNRLARGI